jgi:tripartite-type tricarboxylate transporter receptor subunit TctC
VLGLAVSDAQRRPCLPQVPTLREQGLPLMWQSWSGVLAPAGLPEATVQRLNRAVNQVLALTEVQQVLQRQCLQALPASPGAFDALLRTSVEQARAEVAPFLPRLAVRP